LSAANGRTLLVLSADDPVSGHGSATALRTFLAAAGHAGWQVTTVTPPLRSTPQPVRRALRLIAFTLRAAGIAATPIRADAVISWQPLPTALAGWVLARAAGVPHVVRTCGPELDPNWSPFPLVTTLARPLTERLLGSAAAVVVKSPLERALLPRRVRSERVHLIPNAVTAPPPDPAGPGTALPDRAGPLRLLAVMQLEAHKGVDNLIAAFATSAAGSRHEARLTIVGDGSRRARLERLARRVSADVAFTGRLTGADLWAAHASHDAFVTASPREGCSNATLEALAAGLPVLGYAAALGDLVRDGVNGLLAASPTPAALAVTIDRFAFARTGWPALRAAARRSADRHRPAELLDAYDRLLAALC
jgi:glycosyltransferase involved in cell wall biosynthesis